MILGYFGTVMQNFRKIKRTNEEGLQKSQVTLVENSRGLNLPIKIGKILTCLALVLGISVITYDLLSAEDEIKQDSEWLALGLYWIFSLLAFLIIDLLLLGPLFIQKPFDEEILGLYVEQEYMDQGRHKFWRKLCYSHCPSASARWWYLLLDVPLALIVVILTVTFSYSVFLLARPAFYITDSEEATGCRKCS